MSPRTTNAQGRGAWKTVYLSLRADLVDRIQKVREEKQEGRKKVPLGTVIEDLLIPELERNEALRLYAPYLEQVSIDQDGIFIKDNRIQRIAELRLKGGDLYCDLDSSGD